MDQDGTRSWRFEHDNAQFLELALFVRDAPRLAVAAARDVPPRLAGRDEVFDPPDFTSLAGLPPLRSAAAAVFADAVSWTNRPDRDGRPEPEWFAWPTVRDAAESTAAELGIPAGDLDGVARVLDVEGSWSHLAGPGCALCSPAVATDPAAARLLLHDLFASGRAAPA